MTTRNQNKQILHYRYTAILLPDLFTLKSGLSIPNPKQEYFVKNGSISTRRFKHGVANMHMFVYQ